MSLAAEKYVVMHTALDRIVPEAGYKDDGTPRKVVNHTRGEVIVFVGLEDDDVQRFLDMGAIQKYVEPVVEEPAVEEEEEPAPVKTAPVPPSEKGGTSSPAP